MTPDTGIAEVDGFPRPEKGELKPDPLEPGLGLSFKRGEAAQYRVRI